MTMLSGTGWAVVILTVLLVGAGLAVWRYRALERAGTPLPPGTGGVRLRGLEAVVTRAHDPAGQHGSVVVLGDEWRIADDVAGPLAVGDVVRVLDVVGTAVVVEPVETPDAATPDTDTSGTDDRSHDGRSS